MNVLVLGVTGFVGTWITNRLLDEELTLICGGRDPQSIKNQFPRAKVIECDFNNDVKSSDWLLRLNDVDVIINCVGIFYHQDKEVLWNIHFHAPKALYQAAEQKKIKQIIHFSALGIENYYNEYANSKKAIEEFLHTLTVPSVILRPSLIYGPGSSGGINLLKQLAALPWFIPLPGEGTQQFQPIHVDDLAKAVKNLVMVPPIQPSITLAAVPLDTITLKEMLVFIRQRLGLTKPLFLKIPFPLIKLIAWVRNGVSFSTINSPAVEMLKIGNYTTEQEAVFFQQTVDIIPLDFENGIQKYPVMKKERWYTRLALIRPFLKLALAIMWFMSALTSVLPSTAASSYALLN